MTNTQDTPKVNCRCCGHIMDAKYQHPIVPGKPGFHYLTCQEPTCELVGQTFTDKTYGTVDLALYYKSKVK